jgi:hypothetical protein
MQTPASPSGTRFCMSCHRTYPLREYPGSGIARICYTCYSTRWGNQGLSRLQLDEKAQRSKWIRAHRNGPRLDRYEAEGAPAIAEFEAQELQERYEAKKLEFQQLEAKVFAMVEKGLTTTREYHAGEAELAKLQEELDRLEVLLGIKEEE